MNKNTPTNKQCKETLNCPINPFNCVFKRRIKSIILDPTCASKGCCCNCDKNCIIDDNERFVGFVRKVTYKKLMK